MKILHPLFVLNFYFGCVKSETYKVQNASLEYIPHDIPHTVETLDLGWNQIASLNDTDVAGFADVKTLFLNRNKISYISAQAFSYNTKLEYLDMTVNSVSELPDLTNVKPTLQKLFFSKNPIQAIDENYFNGFAVLSMLRLSTCNLTTFPNLTGIGNTLNVLRLKNNSFGTIDKIAFESLKVLKSLDVSSSNLRQFPDFSLLPSPPKLKTLTLDSNRFPSEITLSAFTKSGVSRHCL